MQLNELQLKKYNDHYLKLKLIFERTTELINTFNPDQLAIEAPFYGKNVQSMLNLDVHKVLQWLQVCQEKSQLLNIHQKK